MMFKKVMLALLLIVLVIPGVIAPPIQVDVSQDNLPEGDVNEKEGKTYNFPGYSSDPNDQNFKIESGGMVVDLEVEVPPEGLKLGSTFDVKVYITPFEYTIGWTRILLLSESTKLVDNSLKSYTLSTEGKMLGFSFYEKGKGGFFRDNKEFVSFKEKGKKYYLGTIKHKVTGSGNIVVFLESHPGSFSKYDMLKGGEGEGYTLIGGKAKFVQSAESFCIPKVTEAVGCRATFVDDGCGGKVQRGAKDTCTNGQVCAENGLTCVSAGLVLPDNAPQHDKTVLETVSKALTEKVDGKDKTKTQKLAALVNALVAWFKDVNNK